MEYGKTLNLPQTDFPMRGNLPQKEPQTLVRWQEMDIYAMVGQKNSGKPKFILHDGPPYANGDIHLGHALNKVLKDIIIKYKSMSGFDAPYVPGWDTHGLPIEQKTIKDLGINRHLVSKVEFRDRCRDYALKYVNLQREEFKRLGVRGDWDNPYLTLQPEMEATQIGAFGAMAKKGYIYKGLKPVYWCPSCETALAEAEIEYEDHVSSAIYVKFPVLEGRGVLDQDAYVVIWTTTPWTIPANMAICLNADYEYVIMLYEGEKLVVAKEMIKPFLKDIGAENAEYTVLKEFKGREAELCACKHPLFDRESLLICGEHVTLEAGTGCVHTAPSHGADDFYVGKKYGIPVPNMLDDKGCYTAEAGEQFEGMNTNDGNKAVITALSEAGLLMHAAKLHHQYPHCWRCHQPILFRATEQWFASIDGFREAALKGVDSVEWVPSWGKDRIYNMIRDRGDWCISRQRTWGVPIPIFYCEDCGEIIINNETISHIQELFAKHGSSYWFAEEGCEHLIPEGLTCPNCGGEHFRKENDTMDVWFDSGSSHFGVLEHREGLCWPADMYLEGSDQHRGWFNSSLCISVANRGVPPYKTVLTHGFLVDEQGRKMSKSLGNTVDPQKVIATMGADVLRLWVASSDYRSDLAVSDNIMKQVSEAYRKIRNTARYLLGIISDFNPEQDAVSYADMPEMDRFMLAKLNRLIELSLKAYEEYEFHVLYHAVHKFCVLDMSAFYLDVSKDTLYAEQKNDIRRRSVQTVAYKTLDALMRLLAPIISFTAEEIYDYMPKADDAPVSVQLLEMPTADTSCYDEALEAKWTRLLELRETVSKELENARRDKVIGHSLDAAVAIYAKGEDYALLASIEDILSKIFIVSKAVLAEEGTEFMPAEGADIAVKVAAAKGIKCERCWIYSESVGESAEYPTLCARCAEVVKELPLPTEG